MLIFYFFIGLAVGSFLNSVIYRLDLPARASARSYCPYCKKTLSWFELIPLMSFILQKGKCRHCRKPISLQYPLVELATGILFVLCGWYFFGPGPTSLGLVISTVFWLFVVSCLIIIFVYDLKHYIIPNQIVYSGIIIAFLYQLQFSIFNFQFSVNFQFPIFNYLLAGLIAGGFFFAIILISRGRWMGMGDVKLAVFMGLILGWPNILVALFGSFLIGAFVSVILIIFKKKTLKSEIPFGPFLAGATLIVIFWGNILINWYLNLFLL